MTFFGAMTIIAIFLSCPAAAASTPEGRAYRSASSDLAKRILADANAGNRAAQLVALSLPAVFDPLEPHRPRDTRMFDDFTWPGPGDREAAQTLLNEFS